MPSPNTLIKPTSKFTKLNIETQNINPTSKFLLRCMRKVKKNKNGCFRYKTLVNLMKKNKDNPLFYTGRGITSVKNINNYWNYSHSHATAYIPDFNKMYRLIPVQHKKHVTQIKRDNVVKNYYINFN